MGEISYRPRYTIADYLLWEGDWELWDGIGDVEEQSLTLLRLAGDGHEEHNSWEIDLHEGC